MTIKSTSMKTSILLLLLVIPSGGLFAQRRYDPKGIVRSQLMDIIHSEFGADFEYVGYTILDSVIAHSLVENDHIRDSYATLKGCILFSTYKDKGEAEPDTFVVGMVRGGKLLWDNAPGSPADLGGHLLYAQDINSDGEIDLLVRENDRTFALMRGPDLSYLYVLSWNGTRGRFINAFEDGGGSSLIGWYFELGGKDRTGARQIVAVLPDLDFEWSDYRTKTFPKVTYTWNGQQYALWLDAKRLRRGHYGISDMQGAPAK